MYNYVMLIGKKKEVKKVNDETIVITLDVVRPFREASGEFKTDTFEIKCSHWVLPNDINFLNNFSHLSVKGRLVPNGEKLEIVGEKILCMGEI